MSLETDDAMSEVVPPEPTTFDLTPTREAHRNRIINRHAMAMHRRYDAGQKTNGGDLSEKPGMLAAAIEENIDQGFYMHTLDDQLDGLAHALRDGTISRQDAADALDRLRR